MKRLKVLILIFSITVSVPLTFVVWQTYQSLSQEELAQLRFFSEALFDDMEDELAELVQREESRAVDEYHFTQAHGKDDTRESPLASPPNQNYIIGYLQNNPDGSFQSPLVPDMGSVPSEKRETVAQLKETNTLFNNKKFALPQKPKATEPKSSERPKVQTKKKTKDLFADRYISKQQTPVQKSYLGSKSVRKEKISQRQALNLSKEDSQWPPPGAVREEEVSAPQRVANVPERMAETSENTIKQEPVAAAGSSASDEDDGFQVEVAPLQSVFIRPGRFFIFRRIVINNQIYRQGFVLEVTPFLNHLINSHFKNQPMAQFTELRLHVLENGVKKNTIRTGGHTAESEVITQRTFPVPFDFLSADLTASAPPPSPARKTMGIALWVLGLFMLAGLAAIYQSARTVVDLSERRSQFVSSVTHELKTPLTNIRMYIEMLEQGIAATPQRAQDYLSILGNESARLSRLINNVLELARLEKKQRHFDMREGRLEDVLTEVRTVMAHKLEQEGFQLNIEISDMPPFAYDREVLIQILINLIENSIKFGQTSPQKCITIIAAVRDKWVRIAVSDTGPGIPRLALKKVFDDFYRVDNNLTRTTGGTGIGLALVKKFMTAMGGRVEAVNNNDIGCTITLSLPLP